MHDVLYWSVSLLLQYVLMEVIRINLSPNPVFCRGEGGWVDGWWAFMIARRGLPEDIGSSMKGSYPPPTGDHKGPPPIHPTALAPTEYWIGAQVDVYYLRSIHTL